MQTMMRAHISLTRRLREELSGERGDVPGWVLITIMTAGIVTAIWAVAQDQLKELFSDALDGVKGPGN